MDKASLPKGSAASLSGAVAREQNVGLFGRQPVDAAERSDGPPFQVPFEIVGVCDRVGGETGDRHPAEQPAPYLGAVVEARLNQDVHGRRIEREPVEQVAQDQRMNATVTKSAEAEALDRIPNDVINRRLCHTGAVTQHEVSRMRLTYDRAELDESHVAATPLEQFHRWLHDAVAEPAIVEPNAMVLGTVGEVPSSRTVLLKGIDESLA